MHYNLIDTGIHIAIIDTKLALGYKRVDKLGYMKTSLIVKLEWIT